MVNLTNNIYSIKKNSECIILIHGLARTSRCMNKAASVFATYGYQTMILDYPSRTLNIEQLVEQYLQPAIKKADTSNFNKVHFMTHSMGGILLRHYLSNHQPIHLGRTVMLSPPNQGSEVVDKLGHLSLFKLINGPAGQQLGTDKNSLPLKLGKADFDVGVITGDRTINPLLSLLIPGKNDGKVGVNRTKVEGMKDFLVLPYSHALIMQKIQAIYQVLQFIQTGQFIH